MSDPSSLNGQSRHALAWLRRFYWQRIRRYAYEVCQDCGRPVGARTFGLAWETVNGYPDLAPRSYWFADNHVWNRVIGSESGVLCPCCFMDRAVAAGLHLGWRCGVVGEIEP